MADKQATTQRDGFKSKWGFILACIGSAVGMGNIWRFPIMVSLWGGMTFLIPYFICVILIGSTGVIGEFALGRATGAGPIGAFGKCTELRGNRKIGEAIGFIPVLGSMALAIGYTVVMGWIFKYTAIAITGDMHAMGQDMAAIGGHFDVVAISNLPWIIVAIVASFAIMAMGVSGGIEKANKVMMPVLFFLFVGLGIYIAFLPGASAGYKYIFTLDPKGLANPMVWIFAFGQAFFSLSVAGNGSVIYGSYLPKKENIPNSARNVAVFDTLAALLAAFVIIPAMAAGGAPLEKGGPGLMFVWLVNVLNGMPGGRIIGVIFFVCVLFAGLSSIINLYEAPVATLQDNLKIKRVPATAIILVIGCVIAILIQKITSEWMDVVSIYICPLGALLAGIMFFWVAGKKFVLDEVNDGLQKPIGGWFYPLAKYVYCIPKRADRLPGTRVNFICILQSRCATGNTVRRRKTESGMCRYAPLEARFHHRTGSAYGMCPILHHRLCVPPPETSAASYKQSLHPKCRLPVSQDGRAASVRHRHCAENNRRL